jgi:hypothetical protein
MKLHVRTRLGAIVAVQDAETPARTPNERTDQ